MVKSISWQLSRLIHRLWRSLVRRSLNCRVHGPLRRVTRGCGRGRRWRGGQGNRPTGYVARRPWGQRGGERRNRAAAAKEAGQGEDGAFAHGHTAWGQDGGRRSDGRVGGHVYRFGAGRS